MVATTSRQVPFTWKLQMDKVVEEYEGIFTSPVGVLLHCQFKHSIDLTQVFHYPMDQSISAPFWRTMKSIGKFKSYCKMFTSIQVHLPVGAWSCWYKRRMGLGDFVLTIEHWTSSLSLIGTLSHGLMISWKNWRGEIFQQDRFEVWISSGTNQTLQCVEDCLQS